MTDAQRLRLTHLYLREQRDFYKGFMDHSGWGEGRLHEGGPTAHDYVCAQIERFLSVLDDAVDLPPGWIAARTERTGR